MAKDKQSTILALLVINTILLVLIAFYTTCPYSKRICSKSSGYKCPLTGKTVDVQQPVVPKGSMTN